MKTVIEMAREAGIDSVRSWKHAETPAVVLLERFAELVLENYRRQSRMTWAGGYAAGAAAEREACAQVCDAFQARDVGMQPAECAGAIRARGQA